MTFQAVLKLQKQQFDQGIKSVQKSLNGLKTTFMQVAGALGAGLGLTALVSNMKTTATQLSVVKASLENVSEGINEYGENLEFLKRIANEYGQDQNALIGSFAKFRAAAGGAGAELSTIRDIYESLTRAAGAYHLSADQTANVMLAVEQMFSKGKVAAEELRRQLGNSLPGAYNIMAKAAGDAGITLNGTAAELEKAMKAGNVMAADVLPFFAKRLREATTGANFDSLQSSLNRFQNSWYDFVENSGFEKFFASIVNHGGKALTFVGERIKALGLSLSSIATAVAGGLGFKGLVRIGGDALTEMEKRFQVLSASSEKFKNTLDQTKAAYQQLAAMDAGKKVTMSLNSAQAAAAGLNQNIVDTLAFLEMDGKAAHDFTITASEGMAVLSADMDKLNAKIKETNAEMLKIGKTTARTTGAMSKALLGIKSLFTTMISTLKAFAGAMVAAFAIGYITEAISRIRDFHKELKRLRELPEQIVADTEKMSDETAKMLGELETQVDIYNTLSKSESERLAALKEINRILDRQGDRMLTVESTAEDVRDAVDGWKKHIISAAEATQKLDALSTANAEIARLTKELDNIKSTEGYGEVEKVFNDMVGYVEVMTDRALELQRTENQITRELRAQEEVRRRLLEAGGGDFVGPPAPASLGNTPLTEDEKAVKDIFDNYTNAVKQLANQKKNGRYTEQEYQKELAKTREKVFDQISVYENLDNIVVRLKGDYSKYYNEVRGSNGSSGGGKSGNTPLDKLRDAIDDYRSELVKLNNQREKGAISEEEYNESIVKTVNSTWKAVAAFSDLEWLLSKLAPDYAATVSEMEALFEQFKPDPFTELFDEINERLQEADEELAQTLEDLADNERKALNLLMKERPKAEGRDTFFDYKKSGSDILGEEATLAERRLKNLEDEREELEALKEELGPQFTKELQDRLDRINAKLVEIGATATDLRTKANVATWREDVKDLKEELSDLRFDSIKNIASSFDRLVDGIESTQKAFEKLEEGDASLADHFKAVMTVINEVIQLFETYKSVSEGIHKVEEAYQKFKDASTAKEALNAATQIAAQEAVGDAELKSAVQTVAAEKAKQSVIEETTGKHAEEAVVGSIASMAGIPYLGPILAAAAAAGIIALIASSMNKFANGGIIPGSSFSGDRQMARVNSGEMILNKTQQANLFRMINNGTVGSGAGGGQVEFKIRGADLIGTINNYNSRMRG